MESKKFFYKFGKLLYQINGFYTEYAKRSKVKENLLWILYALNDGESHSQKEISENWDLPRTTINTIVKELEENEYVKLIQIKGEKREMHVVLTELGQKYAENLLSDLYQLEAIVYEKINNKLLNEDLEELLSNLKGGSDSND